MKVDDVIKKVPNGILQSILESRKLLIIVGITVGLAFVFILGINRVANVFSASEQVRKDVAMKSAFVQSWKNKTDFLKGNEFRPITINEIEGLQGNVFASLEKFRLNLISFGVLSGSDEAKDIVDFEIIFSGPWDLSVKFIEEFRMGNALVVIRNLKMEPLDDLGNIKSIMRYRVYLK